MERGTLVLPSPHPDQSIVLGKSSPRKRMAQCGEGLGEGAYDSHR